MTRLILLMVYLYGTQAIADDYQLIPLPTFNTKSGPLPVNTAYNALVVDQTSGAIYRCTAVMVAGAGLPPTYYLSNIGCTKGTVAKGGAMPSGPAVPSPPSSQPTGTFPTAIWKIDPAGGTLTFCGSSEFDENLWLCGEEKLQ